MVKVPRLSETFSEAIFGIWNSGRVVIASSWVVRFELSALLGVELDDQLLLYRRRDLAALGQAEHLRRQGVVIGLEPGRDRRGQLGRGAHDVARVRVGANRNHVLWPHLIRGNVDP